MPDVKPPRIDGDERETVLALLQYQRESVVRKVNGIDDSVAAASPVSSGTSLLWLVAHLAGAETMWVEHRFAADVSTPEPPMTTLDEAIAAYRATWTRVDAIVAASDLDAPCRGLAESEAPANLRWVLMHLLEETARHAGHADIIRELIDGERGR